MTQTTHRTITCSTGERLHVWEPEGPARAVVQVQHGLNEYAGRYVTEHGGIIARLRDRGFAAQALDFPGHGESPGRRGQVDCRKAVDLHVAARRSAAQRGLPVVLVGHSLGGLVTAGSIAAEPDGIAGAVILSPALVRRVPPPVRLLTRALGATLGGVPFRRVSDSASDLSSRDDVSARAAADPMLHDGRLTFLVGATALEVSQRVWEHAPQWRTPTLLMHGTDDRVTDHDNSELLASLTPAGVMEFVSVAAGRHELLHDTDGDATLARVMAFIDGLATP